MQSIPNKFSNDKDGVRLAVDDILKKLRRFQLDTGTTFILISILNRKSPKCYDYIELDSFKESGGIEYTADVVWGLQWKDKEQEKLTDDEIETYEDFFEVDFCIENNKKIPVAKYDKNFKDEEFNDIKNIAKRFSGCYSSENGRKFLFRGNNGEKNRNEFIKEVKKYFNINKKFLMRQMYLRCLKNRYDEPRHFYFKFYPEFAYFSKNEEISSAEKNANNAE